jgi:hypothetical protein
MVFPSVGAEGWGEGASLGRQKHRNFKIDAFFGDKLLAQISRLCYKKQDKAGEALLFIFFGGSQWLGHVKFAGKDPRWETR